MNGRARRLSVVTIAAVLLLIGVGHVLSSPRAFAHRPLTKMQYEQHVRTVYGGIQRAFRATNVRTGLAARVGAAQAALRRASHDLEQVEPPRDVRGENLVVAQGFKEYADDLEIVRTAAAQGDAASISAFNKAIPANAAAARIAEAAEEMRGKATAWGPSRRTSAPQRLRRDPSSYSDLTGVSRRTAPSEADPTALA